MAYHRQAVRRRELIHSNVAPRCGRIRARALQVRESLLLRASRMPWTGAASDAGLPVQETTGISIDWIATPTAQLMSGSSDAMSCTGKSGVAPALDCQGADPQNSGDLEAAQSEANEVPPTSSQLPPAMADALHQRTDRDQKQVQTLTKVSASSVERSPTDAPSSAPTEAHAIREEQVILDAESVEQQSAVQVVGIPTAASKEGVDQSPVDPLKLCVELADKNDAKPEEHAILGAQGDGGNLGNAVLDCDSRAPALDLFPPNGDDSPLPDLCMDSP